MSTTILIHEKYLSKAVLEYYKKNKLAITNFLADDKGQDYNSCSYQLNDTQLLSRTAKITPKKIGQFVTLWKRNTDGPIAPFDQKDSFDVVTINVNHPNPVGTHGQFVFPKSVLVQKGIVTGDKEGKRGFRVYPPWDKPTSNQALKSQHWQVNYFLSFDPNRNDNGDQFTNLYFY